MCENAASRSSQTTTPKTISSFTAMARGYQGVALIFVPEGGGLPPKHLPPPPRPRDVLERRAPPPPWNPPPLLPFQMSEDDSQNFALAPSVPRGFERNIFFRPAFCGDHRGTQGGSGDASQRRHNISWARGIALGSTSTQCWFCYRYELSG